MRAWAPGSSTVAVARNRSRMARVTSSISPTGSGSTGLSPPVCSARPTIAPASRPLAATTWTRMPGVGRRPSCSSSNTGVVGDRRAGDDDEVAVGDRCRGQAAGRVEHELGHRHDVRCVADDAGDAPDVRVAVRRQQRGQPRRRRQRDLRALARCCGRARRTPPGRPGSPAPVIDGLSSMTSPTAIWLAVDGCDRAHRATVELQHVRRDGGRRLGHRRDDVEDDRRQRGRVEDIGVERFARGCRQQGAKASATGTIIVRAPPSSSGPPTTTSCLGMFRAAVNPTTLARGRSTDRRQADASTGGGGTWARASTRWCGIGAIALAATAMATTANAQSPNDQVGTVRVVHGLRGLVADIYLDGNLALPTFQPERATDPLAIPAGDHVVDIRSAGAAATDTPLLTQAVTVPGWVLRLADRPPRRGRQPDAHGVRRRPDDGAGRADPGRGAPRRGRCPRWPCSSTTRPRCRRWRPTARRRRSCRRAPTRSPCSRPQAGRRSPHRRTSTFAEGTANFMYLIGSEAQGTLGWAAVQVDGPADAAGRDPDRRRQHARRRGRPEPRRHRRGRRLARRRHRGDVRGAVAPRSH